MLYLTPVVIVFWLWSQHLIPNWVAFIAALEIIIQAYIVLISWINKKG